MIVCVENKYANAETSTNNTRGTTNALFRILGTIAIVLSLFSASEFLRRAILHFPSIGVGSYHSVGEYRDTLDT